MHRVTRGVGRVSQYMYTVKGRRKGWTLVTRCAFWWTSWRLQLCSNAMILTTEDLGPGVSTRSILS